MDSLETKLVSAKDLIDFCIFWINEYEQSCSPLAKAKVVELNNVIGHVVGMPHEEPETDEWCTDCKEYDSENHNCPRFNRVIRRTVEETKPERKEGVWIEHLDYGYVECPFCGSATTCDDQEAEMDLHYCFNCGANNRAKIGEQYETD